MPNCFKWLYVSEMTLEELFNQEQTAVLPYNSVLLQFMTHEYYSLLGLCRLTPKSLAWTIPFPFPNQLGCLEEVVHWHGACLTQATFSPTDVTETLLSIPPQVFFSIASNLRIHELYTTATADILMAVLIWNESFQYYVLRLQRIKLCCASGMYNGWFMERNLGCFDTVCCIFDEHC